MTEGIPYGFALHVCMGKPLGLAKDRIDMYLFKQGCQKVHIGFYDTENGTTAATIFRIENELRFLTKATYSMKRILDEYSGFIYYFRLDEDKVAHPTRFSFHHDELSDKGYFCWGDGSVTDNQILCSMDLEEMQALTTLALNVPFTKLPPINVTQLET
jgi:hypothetical protein